MRHMTSGLTVGITTRDRPDSLNTCLRSLDVLRSLSPEILVFDDGSKPPARDHLLPTAADVQILRDDHSPGCAAGRNRLVREASAPAVLLVDDDARILTLESIEQALAILSADPRVAAVAFAQAEADGRPWPTGMQPSPATVPSIIASFIGFAHLVRRDVFLALGGYREDFVYLGEEKDFCVRLLDAGYTTVYLPAARVAHVPDAAGRSRTRYLRFTVRNDCLNAFYNDPFPRVIWTVPSRYARYFRMRRAWGIRDPWGWVWIARELIRGANGVLSRRRPVSGATLDTWRRLKASPIPYVLPAAASRGDDAA
jgi:GT2 family glycosyltransferase